MLVGQVVSLHFATQPALLTVALRLVVLLPILDQTVASRARIGIGRPIAAVARGVFLGARLAPFMELLKEAAVCLLAVLTFRMLSGTLLMSVALTQLNLRDGGERRGRASSACAVRYVRAKDMPLAAWPSESGERVSTCVVIRHLL